MLKLLNLDVYKTSGFYISISAIITFLIASLVYTFGFNDVLLEYNNSTPLIIGVIGIIIFAILVLIKATSKYASITLWGFIFVSFLIYITNIYMYFTGVFYNGLTAEALSLVDMRVVISLGAYLVFIIVGNVAIYQKHSLQGEE